MAGFLISMKLTVLRRSMSGARAASLIIGAMLGLAAAVGTVLLGLLTLPPSAAVPFYAVLCLLWTFGWLIGPLLTGGDAILRLEYFTLFPLRPRRLAAGLLAATFTGITPVITAIAFGVLLVYGIRLNAVAALVAVPAIALQLVLVIVLSRVATQALGSALRSRIGWELSALVAGLVIAFLNSGWWALGFFGKLFSGHWAGHVSTVVRWLPSGWATVAVNAAGHSDWLLMVAALGGLVLLCLVLFRAWAALLGRHLVRGTVTTKSRVAHAAIGADGGRRLPATPFGAVLGKELRLWLRDPRRARFTRIALWIGVFTGLIPLLSGSKVLLPWSGVVAALFAGALSANLYGMDAGALWLTMVAPGMERTDVRARQAAWLMLVLPVTLVLTAVMAFCPVPDQLWPWVLALLPATIGAGAGLIPLVSLLGPAPFPDRPGGNPLDGFSDESGDQVRMQTLIVLVLELLCAAPAAAIVLAGRLLHSTVLQWLGLPAGVIAGVFFAWLFGRLAYGRLRGQGPEILDIMRKGPQRDPVRLADAAPDPAQQDLPSGIAAVAGLLMSLGILSLIPQGIVALVLGSVHAKARSWFLALYFSAPDRLLISIGFILAGLALISGAATIVWTTRRQQRRAAAVSYPARKPERVGVA